MLRGTIHTVHSSPRYAGVIPTGVIPTGAIPTGIIGCQSVIGERAITIRKAWESFGGGSEEISWLMKSLTGRFPKDRTIFRKRTIIHDHSSEGDQQKEYKEEKHALEMD
jgi:hypothetical protein